MCRAAPRLQTLTMDIRSWETLAAMVAGIRASVCGPDAIIFTWMPRGFKGASGQCCRVVKVQPAPRGPAAAAASGLRNMWGCLVAGVAGAAAAGPATELRVRSFMSAAGDPEPLEVRRCTAVRVPAGAPDSETVAALLAAVWDHSRALWTPATPSIIASAGGPEQCLPLSTPISRCFRVCVGLAARISRPVHTVSNTIRSPVGGSAVLKSPAYGAGATLVLNVQVSNAASAVVVVGKREGHRAVKASRPLPNNIAVMSGDNGWQRKPGSSSPLSAAALEMTLYAILQALVEVIQNRQ